jgi:hypothetical protein
MILTLIYGMAQSGWEYVELRFTEKELSDLVALSFRRFKDIRKVSVRDRRVRIDFDLFNDLVYYPKRGILKVSHMSTEMRSLIEEYVDSNPRVKRKGGPVVLDIGKFREYMAVYEEKIESKGRKMKAFRRNRFDRLINISFGIIFVSPMAILFLICLMIFKMTFMGALLFSSFGLLVGFLLMIALFIIYLKKLNDFGISPFYKVTISGIWISDRKGHFPRFIDRSMIRTLSVYRPLGIVIVELKDEGLSPGIGLDRLPMKEVMETNRYIRSSYWPLLIAVTQNQRRMGFILDKSEMEMLRAAK